MHLECEKLLHTCWLYNATSSPPCNLVKYPGKISQSPTIHLLSYSLLKALHSSNTMLSGLFSSRKKAYPEATAEGKKSKPPRSSSEKTTRDRGSDKRRSSRRVSDERSIYPEAPMPPISGGTWTKFATDSDHSSSRRGHYTSAQRDGGVAGSSKSRHRRHDCSDKAPRNDTSRNYSSPHRSEDLGASYASSAHGYRRHEEYVRYDAEFDGGYDSDEIWPLDPAISVGEANWRKAKAENRAGQAIDRKGFPIYVPTEESLYTQGAGQFNVEYRYPSYKRNSGEY